MEATEGLGGMVDLAAVAAVAAAAAAVPTPCLTRYLVVLAAIEV
jgi:hypothetical protein